MATIVKLVRISLLGHAVFVLGVWFAYRQRQEAVHLSEQFVFGAGDQHIALAELLSQTGKWIITCAMAGVGLSTAFSAMKAGGMRPLVLGVLAGFALALLGLGVAYL
jgi:uncharacterized membrane protein YadS